MKECNKMRGLLVGLIYGEIDEKSRNILEDHLKHCENCLLHLEQMKQTLATMDLREKHEPAKEFWEDYWDKLVAKMEMVEPTAEKQRFLAKLKKHFTFTYVPAYKWAAGLTILVIGILIGRYYFGSKQSLQPTDGRATHDLTLVNYRAQRYLERSKVLLLGIANLQLKADEKVDLSKEREVSQSLIKEALYLRENLKGREGQQFQDLINDLEAILIEIANMEDQEDLPNVELLRGGIDRQGILLKINIHEMETSSVGLKQPRG